jgi:hypothetical protein
MAVFSRRHEGAAAAHRLLRGVIVGSFAFASFFVAVAVLVQGADLLLVYALATSVALVVNGISLATIIRRWPAG